MTKKEDTKNLLKQLAEKKANRKVDKRKEDMFYGDHAPPSVPTSQSRTPASSKHLDALIKDLSNKPLPNISDLVEDDLQPTPNNRDNSDNADARLMSQLHELSGGDSDIMIPNDYEMSHGYSSQAQQEAEAILNNIDLPSSQKKILHEGIVSSPQPNSDQLDAEVFNILLMRDWGQIFSDERLKVYRESILEYIARNDILFEDFTSYCQEHKDDNDSILDKMLSILMAKL